MTGIGGCRKRNSHHGTVLDLQLRGEYVYAACGADGFIAYDVANIGNKGFSERIVTAPVSPLGQRLYVKTKYATSVCSPSTLAIDPTRARLEVDQKLSDGSIRKVRPNQEDVITEIGDPSRPKPDRPIHPLTRICTSPIAKRGWSSSATLRTVQIVPAFRPCLMEIRITISWIGRRPSIQQTPRIRRGLLRGARHMALYGAIAYICCDAGNCRGGSGRSDPPQARAGSRQKAGRSRREGNPAATKNRVFSSATDLCAILTD